jgi:hypothetical protein
MTALAIASAKNAPVRLRNAASLSMSFVYILDERHLRHLAPYPKIGCPNPCQRERTGSV